MAKAFDQLPMGRSDFLWEIINRLDFPKIISPLMKDMYANLVRKFKFNGFLGAPIISDGLRSALQECVFSMIAMNVAVIVWFHIVHHKINANALIAA